ncbi:MAG: hypothetical protein VXA34_00990 [Gammaproteobacteria bacterium]
MSETPAERARRKARQERAAGVYGVGATQLLRGLRHLRAEEGWEEIPNGATITPEGIYMHEEE